MPDRTRRRLLVRAAVAAGAGAGLVVTGVVVPSQGGSHRPTAAGSAAGYQQAYVTAARQARELLGATGTAKTVYLPDGSHTHLRGVSLQGHRVVYDSATKNALSRGGETAGDSTTSQQATANRRAAARQRAQSDPPLTHVRVDPLRRSVPQDRYAMYNGCYRLQSATSGRWLTGSPTPRFTAGRRRATPVYFKASDLGRYLLFNPGGRYLRRSGTTTWSTTLDRDAIWRAQGRRGTFRLYDRSGRGLAVARGGAVTTGRATPLRLRLAAGCRTFPESQVDVSGRPFAGRTTYQEVRGTIDAHIHGMAFEFLGGDVHCGRPWSPYGAPTALTDCPDHRATGGKGAVLESFLSGDLDGHDPVGWPTFKDWPAPHSLTHEGTYYKWMERSWRAGQRMLVNLLVENNQLCQMYPLKRNSCDDMTSIRLQARDMHRLQRYVDAQHGGPGRGWYRIVTTPAQARRVINRGKLAVVMGIETSVPFGCGLKLGRPTCDRAQLDRQLDSVHRMGVTQVELVNKFDNALAGVAGDEGNTGQAVNFANFKETGSYWRMKHCQPQDPEVHDKDQIAQPANPTTPAQDVLFGAVAEVSQGWPMGGPAPATPVYEPPHHCNELGLSSLGAYTIRGMAKRHMVFDPDHMSVKARKAALDEVARMGYSGVVSSHSWSTPDAYPRIYRDRGFITPYAGDSKGFVAKWRRHTGWANPRTYWGFGYGADINGLGAQGEPRHPSATQHPVRYPFKAYGGVTVHRQHAGRRVYDINRDGVAQYGLYPDWIQDLRMLAGNAIVKDMYRGPESYLQMWERADGVRPNACTNGGRRTYAFFRGLRQGITTDRTLRVAGQPDRRLGRHFDYCTQGGRARVTFTQAGRLASVSRL